MSPLSLGIIGCGRVTQQLHLPALQNVSAIRVTALCDADPARAEKLSRLVRAKVHRTAPELIADRSVEAIAICTPPDAHRELTLHALAAGKHLLVEKPLAGSLEDATAMKEAADSESVAAVGFNLRFHRSIQRARRLISAGELGDVVQIITTFSAPIPSGPMAVSLDIGVHHIDVCRFLLQDSPVGATIMASEPKAAANSAILLLRTARGVLISSSFSYSATPVNEFRIIGTRAIVSFSLYDASSFTFSSSDRPGHGPKAHFRKLFAPLRIASRLPTLLAGGDYSLSYRREWEAFARAAQGKATDLATFTDGLAAIKILYQADENAR